jgi:hypothetical protein
LFWSCIQIIECFRRLRQHHLLATESFDTIDDAFDCFGLHSCVGLIEHRYKLGSKFFSFEGLLADFEQIFFDVGLIRNAVTISHDFRFASDIGGCRNTNWNILYKILRLV